MSTLKQYSLFTDNKELQVSSSKMQEHFPHFPSTRYQGSKRKVLPALSQAFAKLDFTSVLDLYSGSGMVSLLLRHLNKTVDSNDCLLFNQVTARLFLRLQGSFLSSLHYELGLPELLENTNPKHKHLVQDSYRDIFFTDQENAEIDRFSQNVGSCNELERDLYVYAVGQALMKKRPYNLFHRANLSMRKRDVKRSFGNAVTWETSILEHSLKAITELKKFPFLPDARSGKVFGVNTIDLTPLPASYDLVYLDPPYLNSKGVGVDYSDFYGFLDGLCDYQLFGRGDEGYPHRPMPKQKSNWLKVPTALDELDSICKKWASSILFLSYRSDGLPTPQQTREVLSQRGRKVEIHSCGEYKYALSTTNTNEELFLISLP